MSISLSTGATLVEDYDFIWGGDPALKKGKTLKKKYAEYLEKGDEKILPVMEGAAPVRWKLRHLRAQARARAYDLTRSAGTEQSRLELLWRMASMVIVGVEGLKNADGTEATIDLVPVRGVSVVSDNDLEQIDANFPGLIIDIGMHAMSQMSPSKKW